MLKKKVDCNLETGTAVLHISLMSDVLLGRPTIQTSLVHEPKHVLHQGEMMLLFSLGGQSLTTV